MIIPLHKITQTKTGIGLVVISPIKKGEIVWEHEYGHEFRLPTKLYLALSKYGYQDGNDVVVDLDQSRFFNHSCDANIINDGDNCVAARDIIPGEELTWDYGENSLQGFECRCGSGKCRGIIDSALPQLTRPWGYNTKSEFRQTKEADRQ